MLKWIVPPRSGRDSSAGGSLASHPSTSSPSPAPRVTDDPLAAINIHHSKSSRYSKLSLPFGQRKEEEEIYSVTRVNPLFEDGGMSDKVGDNEPAAKSTDSIFSRETESSRPSTRHSPASSGYESWVSAPNAGRLIDQRKPASNDYRREFVLGRDDRCLPAPKSRKGPAETPGSAGIVSTQDPVTLPRIGRANVIHQDSRYVTRVQMADDSGRDNQTSRIPKPNRKIAKSTPHLSRTESQQSMANPIHPPKPIWPTSNANRKSPKSEAVIEQNENYVTQILISPPINKDPGESNYDSIITDSLLMWMSYDQPQGIRDSSKEDPGIPGNCTDENAVRQLSQTMSQSKTIATVSKAFSSSSSKSNASLSDRPSSGSNSISKGFWLVRDFWEKNALLNNGRQLLVESDEDDDERRANQRRILTPGGPPFLEVDRLSNSSSSGSRRVTFSADTVDNEPSSKSSTSGSSSSELRLNPIYLPRYQGSNEQQETQAFPRSHQQSTDNQIAITKQRYYNSNLQMHSSLPNDQRSKATSSSAEQQKLWENYYGSFNKMETYGNLQLHPNHPAVCADHSVCLDFTLDSGDVSLIQRNKFNEKLRKRVCCCILILLAVGIVIVVVVGISLYLTHGQKYFGSI